MAIGARVESVDALQAVKIALAKFAEDASMALGESDAELQRTLMWLETEQMTYWQGQQRSRATLVAQAREALQTRTMFKGVDGRVPSAVEEKKNLELAMRRLAEAEQKIQAVKKWTPRLKNEIVNYRGSVGRLSSTVQSDIPLAIGQLEAMIGSLEAYLTLKDPAAPDVAGDGIESPTEETPPPPPPPEAESRD